MTEPNRALIERYKKKTKLRKRRRTIFYGFIIVCALFVAGYWAAKIDFFKIDSVSVTGNISAPEAEIVSGSGLDGGINGLVVMYRNLLGIPVLRMLDVEKHLAADFPFIRKVTVSYLIPDRVSIRIVEKEPVFIFDVGGSKYFMDIEAKIIGPADKRPDVKPPVIYGFDAAEKLPGDSLLPENDRKFAALEGLISALKNTDKNYGYALYDMVTSYDINDLFAISFTVNGILNVNIGDMQDIDAKIRFVNASYVKDLAGKKAKFTYTADGEWIFTQQ